MKTCKVCNIEKADDAFEARRNQCKECRKAIQRDYRRSNNKAQEWIEKNRERFAELQHNNYVKNKEKINEKYVERYANDPHFKKMRLYRRSMSSLVHGETKTSKHIDCDRDFFLEWLESAFTDEMTMENYGEVWVLDHVIPLDKVKTDEDFVQIAKWWNIRPVTMKYNLVKNKYVDHDQALLHLANLKKHTTDELFKSYEDLLAKHLVAGNP
jgi:hypothetical protein